MIESQRIAAALMRFRAEKGLPPEGYVDILVALHAGWLYYDGERICETPMVAVKPERVKSILAGAPMTDADVMERLS